jgi:hypothetical protein
VITPGFVAKSREPYGVSLQRFGKTTLSAFIISCTQEFSLMGSRVIISDPAATRMAIAAAVVGSIVNKWGVLLPA